VTTCVSRNTQSSQVGVDGDSLAADSVDIFDPRSVEKLDGQEVPGSRKTTAYKLTTWERVTT